MSSEDILLRDIVFPLVIAERTAPGEVKMVQFLGTGFLVGSQGYALTASHVIDVKLEKNQAIVGLFINKEVNEWRTFNADTQDIHPTEDVALLKMGGDHWEKSEVSISFEKQFASAEYNLFGYPQANLYEKVDVKDEFGRVLGRPDLIYSKGHIRRRISFSLPSIKGSCFYELSEPVGAGCSGSPIFKSTPSGIKVFGIYIADKKESVVFEGYNKDLDWEIKTLEIGSGLSYAVRMDDLNSWVLPSLGKTLDQIN